MRNHKRPSIGKAECLSLWADSTRRHRIDLLLIRIKVYIFVNALRRANIDVRYTAGIVAERDFISGLYLVEARAKHALSHEPYERQRQGVALIRAATAAYRASTRLRLRGPHWCRYSRTRG